MNARIEKGVLHIEIPMYAEPALSSNGGTKIVASSGGFTATPVQVAGLPVFLNVTALVKPPELESVRKANRARK